MVSVKEEVLGVGVRIKPVVAIVGRPNVGKSTLFNRLIGRKKAIVANEPGVTRDLNYADMEECGCDFTLVDTGGFEPVSGDVITEQVAEQMRLAIEDADLIVLLFDRKSGPAPGDTELVSMLRSVDKPVVYAVNKVDTAKAEAGALEFYSLGVNNLVPISAEAGRNMDGLMDAVIALLPDRAAEESLSGSVSVAIVGRPNVGKSSILNRLIGRKRALVSGIAGTTRDPVDTPFELDGKKYLFIDTAGIRKKQKVSLTVESYCVMEAIRSIDRCDCAVLVLDASAGVTSQDEKIAGLVEDRGRCCVIVVNKWDAVEKDTHTTRVATEKIREKLHFVTFAPVLFVSALTGQRVLHIFSTVDRVIEEAGRSIPTSALNVQGQTRQVLLRHPDRRQPHGLHRLRQLPGWRE
jgi:GTP-binding protein